MLLNPTSVHELVATGRQPSSAGCGAQAAPGRSRGFNTRCPAGAHKEPQVKWLMSYLLPEVWAWVPVRHASACGWPDLPGSGAWCVRVVVYGGAVAGGSQGWPVNS